MTNQKRQHLEFLFVLFLVSLILFSCKNPDGPKEPIPERPILEESGITDQSVTFLADITKNTASYTLYYKKNAGEWISKKNNNIVEDKSYPGKSLF